MSRTDQHDIVRAVSEARVAVLPRPVVDRSLLSKRLMGTMVDIVGTETNENGRSCHAHEVCGEQLVPGSKVGMYARVVEVYSTRSHNITKQQKRHRNLGCCVAKILRNAPVRSI